MKVVNNFPPTPLWSRVFDRSGARAGARQPPHCSFYLAIQPAKNYQEKRTEKKYNQSSHRVTPILAQRITFSGNS